jgi:hypothetical protein
MSLSCFVVGTLGDMEEDRGFEAEFEGARVEVEDETGATRAERDVYP